MLAQLVHRITHERRYIIPLVVINLLAVVYGFYWYKDQLATSPVLAWIIVADSPLSCLYLAVAQIAFLRGKRAPLFEGLGYLGMMVYGLWTTFVLFLWGFLGGQLTLVDWLLILGHVGMFLEGLFFLIGRGTKYWTVGVATAWFLFDHWLDYSHGFYPTFPNPERLVFVRNVTVIGTLLLAALMLFVIARKQRRAALAQRS